MRFVTLLWLAASSASATEVGVVSARRTTERIRLDGRLNEPAWQTAPAYDGFSENFPSFGAAPSLRTELKVLFDDKFLYVGVRCFDSQPDLIERHLGRRDSVPTADAVELALDSSADKRTAYAFSVNAAGVLRDRLLFADFNSTDTWDAVWDAVARIDEGGWTAEFAIPLRVLRFDGKGSSWGIALRRVVPRTHQLFESVPIPLDANPVSQGALVVSRFGRLEGLEGLSSSRDLEFTPYLSARGVLRPQYSDPTVPTPRLLDPSLDLGVDFKVALTSRLALNATVNPDFGQVEADQVIQNVSTAEPFFPEKRPFFLQGLDVFQPVGAEYGSQMQWFYSRRIGLNTPLLGAAKLTGTVGERTDIGILDAVVLGARAPTPPVEARPDRRAGWSVLEPLRLGLNDTLPALSPQPTNYLAAVARQRLFDSSSVGAFFTAATPLGARCQRGEFASDADFAAAECAPRGANALGVDWNLRTASGVWGFFGQAQATQQVGEGSARTLPDGTLMHPGDLGLGAHFRAGKLGGEPFRFDVSYAGLSPKLDLNAVGFQPLSNFHWTDLMLHYVRATGIGPFRSLNVDYWLDLNWSSDGRWFGRGVNSNVFASLMLPSFDTLVARLGFDIPQFEMREITGTGKPLERLPDTFLAVGFATDGNRRLSASGDVFGIRLFGNAVQPSEWGGGFDLSVVWRPTDRLETRVDSSYARHPQGARFLATQGSDSAVFGRQEPAFLSVTLRQQLVMTPRLTLQVYGQLFSGVVAYAGFYAANIAGPSVHADAMTPFLYAQDPTSHSSVLNLNAVLRWEYRLGSTFFFVYSHSQQEYVPPAGVAVATTELPAGLFKGPAVDTVMVKWTYWWAA